MKITRFETFIVPPRWMFLKIETDEGITGWGEPTLEGWVETMKAAMMEISDYFIGQNPLHIERHWQAVFRNGCYRGGPVLMSVIAGIDQALWDIKGKYYQAPVHELLGGMTRDRIRMYTWIGGDRPHNVAEDALRAQEIGFSAVKMNATEELHYIDSYRKIDESIARVASIREKVGGDLEIAIDFHGRVHKAMAKILVKELEPYRPMFYEDPVLSEHKEALRDIAVHSHVPIALGVSNNVFIQEQSLGLHYNKGNEMLDYLLDASAFQYRDGYLSIPEGPGLGIEINEEYVRKQSNDQGRFRAPFWRNEDGTVAEW